MVGFDTKRTEDLLKLAIGLVILVLINLLASRYFFRLDLTEENRYTIKDSTKDMLKNLDDAVYVEVYLEGNLNADFERLKTGIRETLNEFRVFSDNKINYSFIDPTVAIDEKARNEFISGLAAKGITPTRVYDEQNGQRIQKLILPGAVVSYGGGEKGVMLLKGTQAVSAREKINQSIEGVEYELASAIAQLSNVERKKVGLIKGHGELDSLEIAGFRSALATNYVVENIHLTGKIRANEFDAVVIAKPSQAYTEQEKYYLDQYIMQGGKALFLIDKLEVNMDSIASDNNFAFPYNLNLDDLLFRYGVRLNNDLVQDMVSASYPIVVGNYGDQPQIQMMPWPFFPLISKYAEHPTVKNLDAITTKFVSTIDTVKAEGVKKTPLLFTSPYSRRLAAPVKVSINELRTELSRDKLNKQHLPVGYMLEGSFTSLFKNRFMPEGIKGQNVLERSASTKIAVIADGDIAGNAVNPKSKEPMELGYDPYTRQKFANEDLLMNILSYLTDDHGLIEARTKEVKIRPLDTIKVKEEKFFWQVINLVLPIVLLMLFGGVKYYWRKRKYSSFNNAA